MAVGCVVPADDDRLHAGKRHWVGIVDAAHDAIAGKVDERKMAHTANVLERFEQDLAPHIEAIVGPLLDHPDVPDALKSLLSEIVTPHNFTTALLVGVAVGSIVAPALGAATAPAVQALANTVWHGAATTPGNPGVIHISPLEAATGVLKGVLEQAAAATIAAYSGTSSEEFDHLVKIAGNAPGIAELLLLKRRGKITDEHYEAWLQYSNLNPAFYGDIDNLIYAPPGTGAVLSGRVKNHLSPEDALRLYKESGNDPANFEWEVATTGRPLGLEQMLHLLNRQVMSLDDVRQGILQSDVNPAYTEWALELQHYYPPPRSVVPMLRDGAINETQARTLLSYYGAPDWIVTAFIAEAHHTSSSGVKEISQSVVTRMYVARLINRDTALQRLETLKYPAEDANLLLDYADQARHEQYLNAVIRKVGTLYVAWKIAKVDASTALADAGVPSAAQTDLLTLWEIERTANVHVPTPTAIMHAYRIGVGDAADTRRRLAEAGIQPEDMFITIVAAYPPGKTADAVAAVDDILTH